MQTENYGSLFPPQDKKLIKKVITILRHFSDSQNGDIWTQRCEKSLDFENSYLQEQKLELWDEKRCNYLLFYGVNKKKWDAKSDYRERKRLTFSLKVQVYILQFWLLISELQEENVGLWDKNLQLPFLLVKK